MKCSGCGFWDDFVDDGEEYDDAPKYVEYFGTELCSDCESRWYHEDTEQRNIAEAVWLEHHGDGLTFPRP